MLISSGESLRSVLEGNFREILHSVIREQLSERLVQAENFRREYVQHLQEKLLSPLRDHIDAVLGGMFSEIKGSTLTPEVSAIDATLSHVQVVSATLSRRRWD
jgi:hypothetical protein